MTNVKNELPIAIHHASGGSARVRLSGSTISLEGVSGGSFQVTGGTRYRLFSDIRGSAGAALLVGYSTPLTSTNAFTACGDLGEVCDDVPEGTMVYFQIVSPVDLQPITGAALDLIHFSIYG